MRDSLRHLLGSSWQQSFQWLQLRKQELEECRECGRTVDPLQSTCAHCGATHPARISLSACLMVGAFGITLAFLALI